MKLQTLRPRLIQAEKVSTALAKRVEDAAAKQYRGLPQKFGWTTFDELVLDLAPRCSPEFRAKLNGAAPRPASRAHTKPAPLSTGNRHTPELKTAVRKSLEAGEKVAAISRETGIPATTLKGWKKAWRLTRGTKGKAAAKAHAAA